MSEQPDMAEIERAFLRHWGWLLPAWGGMAVLALATHGWAWVTLDGSLARPWWSPSGWAGCAIGVAMGGGLWGAWRMLLGGSSARAERGWVGWSALALAALAIVLGDMAFRHRAAQEPFWLAVRARLRPGNTDYFIRELASLHLASMETRDARPGLVLAGSSQLLHGIDIAQLQRELADRVILRRSLAGMDPLKACGARGFFSLREGDILLLYIGESDVGANPDLATDWIRPLASWSGTRDVARALGPFARSHWRQLTDLGMASSSVIWRSRDYARHVLFHLWAPEPEPRVASVRAELLPEHRAAYARASTDQPFNEVHYRACAELARLARARGIRMVVLEGQVNPELHTPGAMALAEQVRGRLQDLAERLGFRYVTLAEQSLDLSSGDWLDGAHLSESGRAKFTGMVIRVAQGERP